MGYDKECLIGEIGFWVDFVGDLGIWGDWILKLVCGRISL